MWIFFSLEKMRQNVEMSWNTHTIVISEINPFVEIWWKLEFLACTFCGQINAEIEISPCNEYSILFALWIVHQHNPLGEAKTFNPFVEFAYGLRQSDRLINIILCDAGVILAKFAEFWLFSWSHKRMKIGFNYTRLKIQ